MRALREVTGQSPSAALRLIPRLSSRLCDICRLDPLCPSPVSISYVPVTAPCSCWGVTPILQMREVNLKLTDLDAATAKSDMTYSPSLFGFTPQMVGPLEIPQTKNHTQLATHLRVVSIHLFQPLPPSSSSLTLTPPSSLQIPAVYFPHIELLSHGQL